jgi:hypothetical protein
MDKRQSARDDIRRKLETELEISFTGKKAVNLTLI